MAGRKQNSGQNIFAEERKLQILEMVRCNKKVTVQQLCEAFEVSSPTIRNDLRDLQANGLLIRTHGGAIEKTKMSFELDSRNRHSQNLPQKQKIARAAAALVEPGDRMIIDAGSTTLEMTKLLVDMRDITVVTNDFESAQALEYSESIEVLFLGGFVRKKFHCTVGRLSEGILEDLRVDKAFMGATHFSLEEGATTPDVHQAEMKKAMIRAANQVILLCDSSKIGHASFARFAGPEQIHTLITDHIDADTRGELEEAGTEILLASR